MLENSVEPSRYKQWQAILLMTEQLQQLSENENWQALTDLSIERQFELGRFFSTQVSADEVEDIAAGIKLIMQSDEALVERSRRQQQALSSEIKKTVIGGAALKIYGDVQNNE